MKKHDDALLATNRKALRDYEVLESLEVGIVLGGTEIKSARRRSVSLDESFARVDGGEVLLYNMHVSPYAQGGRYNLEPTRQRKLLLHRQEIRRLYGLLSQRRLTLIPLRMYLKRGFAKIELAACKGKHEYEKRQTIQTREADRELRRMVRTRQRHGD